MGETRVDLLHLLEDLRDAYPGSLEETIVTEAVANALDSGATCITLRTDPAAATLTVIDDGAGMKRRALARYHDIAASTKIRGAGIGFAGVGIKLGLLVSHQVVTETRRGRTHVATRWHLATRHRAPWKWVEPPGDVVGHGTAVRWTLTNPLSPLLDPGFLETAIRRHYETLFDPAFDDILRRHYAQRIVFEVNGETLARVALEAPRTARLEIRLARRRKASAVAVLARYDDPLPEDQQGIAVSTYGKVIKRGWDWLGLVPASPDRLCGLVEAPELAGSLTLSKADFIRTGSKGAAYLAYRKVIQEAVSRQLAAWGDSREASDEPRPKTVRLERDLQRVLEDLTESFPLLASLIDRRRGGQKPLPILEPGDGTAPAAGDGAGLAQGIGTSSGASRAPEEPPAERDAQPGSSAPNLAPLPVVGDDERQRRRRARRPLRVQLDVQFEARPDDPELGRLVESTVWINQAHPAYQRAVASRSIGYHICLAVALALAPLAVPPPDEHAFITAFLARWGEGLADPPRRSPTSRRPSRSR